MRLSPAALLRRAAEAEDRLRHCDLCPWRCGVDRLAGARGRCGLGAEGRWTRELLHEGDEPEVSPTHLIDLAGCNLRCAYCSEGAFVCAPEGPDTTPLDPVALATRVRQRQAEGARSLSLAGGEPGVQLPAVLRLLAACPNDVRVVWNSNLWTTEESLRALDGVVDVYLPDLKFGGDDCARRLAGAEDYGATLERNLRLVAAQQVPVLVRHLVLPGHLDCCTAPVLRKLRAEFPQFSVNLMTVYLPFSRMGRAGLAPPSPLDEEERRRAIALLAALAFPDPRVDGDPFEG